ncbi:hypothetical protein MTR67_026432 [Solanum verrucosum]|uniref:Uncharacterized protein n=1 Tax=Solanum verrucosum TaxID=315347 RepID=A0AAF0R304_SOLVR|nr:hypothetical protein MTR67_026432 [Solanum verrucosum]
MPEDFPRQWKSLGFTDIHFGVVRVALTYHGRKGQPVMARLSFLDTRCYEYQHANLGTYEITFNAGTVFVTIFLNFNMYLHDPYLTKALKIQVQILGASQGRDAIQATINYQLAWRVQNHDRDLSLPGGQKSLFLNIDATNGTTQCTQIPRQIPRKELVIVLHDAWVTKYEKLRVHPQHLFFDETNLNLSKNDLLSHFPNKMPNQIVFHIHMHQCHINIPEDTDAHTVFWFLSSFKCEHDWTRQFNQDGCGVQWFNCPFTGHSPWNIDCDCKGCQKDDLDKADRKKSRLMCENSKNEFKTRYDDGDPTIGSLSQPSKYEFLVSYKTQNESALPT